jgi:hypothetical protein
VTNHEAKTVALQSLQTGRIRAKEVVERVLSCAFASFVRGGSKFDTDRVTKFVTDALMDPNHKARKFQKINRLLKKGENKDYLDQCFEEGRIKIRC